MTTQTAVQVVAGTVAVASATAAAGAAVGAATSAAAGAAAGAAGGATGGAAGGSGLTLFETILIAIFGTGAAAKAAQVVKNMYSGPGAQGPPVVLFPSLAGSQLDCEESPFEENELIDC